jgi:hypothetical protein
MALLWNAAEGRMDVARYELDLQGDCGERQSRAVGPCWKAAKTKALWRHAIAHAQPGGAGRVIRTP